MDPFSHILLGYLVGFGAFGPSGLPYVVVSAVAGALPDLDVALFPLSKRFPSLRHRGISHSIFGVTVIAAVGSLVVPHALGRAFGPEYSSGSIVLYFVAMELGGLSHVLLDSLDHWSVPILAPFSEHEYRFDADRIVNVGSMSFTVLAYVLMLDERGRAALWVWVLTTYALVVVALGYIALRLLARWRAGLAQRRGGFRAVIPQANPFVFLFVGEEETESLRRLRLARFTLGRGSLVEFPSVLVNRYPASTAEVRSASDALARSYEPAIKASRLLGVANQFAKLRELPDCFEVFWYSVDVVLWGRAAGVLARVDRFTGSVTTRNVWREPSRAFG